MAAANRERERALDGRGCCTGIVMVFSGMPAQADAIAEAQAGRCAHAPKEQWEVHER
jgi:hypothetical protein